MFFGKCDGINTCGKEEAMKIGTRLLTLSISLLFLSTTVLSADEAITLENVVSPGPNRADEPFREEFSVKAAAKYLDAAAKPNFLVSGSRISA